MRNNENGRHYAENTGDYGTARRTNLGSVPVALRINGGDRESRRVDVFEVHDESHGRTYTYLCVAGIEMRFAERQSDLLAMILN
ncbi:hypothetical protein [Corynebacterium sp. AOP40-4SA-5]|uniref:hypothetical protein n=1 Tax=Corynebacterium sp. AOP40-4SA-5 TaxID=3457678 RepID=UPI004034CE25